MDKFLRTEHLFLRPPLDEDDAPLNEALQESLDSLDEQFDFISYHCSTNPNGGLVRSFKSLCGYGDDNETFHLFEQAGGQFVGYGGLHSFKKRRGEAGFFCAEVACWIRQSQTGKGYATEAFAALAQRAFKAWGCREVWFIHAVKNKASARIAEKLGFIPSGKRNDYAATLGLGRGPYGAPPNYPIKVMRACL